LTISYQSDITLTGDRVADTTAIGGIPMNTPNEGMRGWRQVLDYTPLANRSKGLRGWWLTPPRPGIYRVIPPWVYRHLRFFGVADMASGSIPAAAGLICLCYGAYGWAAFFLALAALALAGGYWYLTIDRAGSARA
jgi:hypothetical protein